MLQVITFDTGALPDDASAEQLRDCAIFRDTYLHITSLLHAIAIQTLCNDAPGADLVMHDSLAHTPAADARQERLDTIFGRTHMGMSSWQDVFMLRGRASPSRTACERLSHLPRESPGLGCRRHSWLSTHGHSASSSMFSFLRQTLKRYSHRFDRSHFTNKPIATALPPQRRSLPGRGGRLRTTSSLSACMYHLI